MNFIEQALASNDARAIALAYNLSQHPLSHFTPRPDKPELLDQQESFYSDNFSGLSCVIAGNGCLAGETEIYDPVDGDYKRLDEIKKPFHVYARTPDGRKVIAWANKPFVKGTANLYEVRLSNGQSFVATLDHRILCDDVSAFLPLRQVGAFHPLTSSEPCLSMLPQGEPHCWEIAQDYQASCFEGCCQCDERLLQDQDSDLNVLPSPGDVHAHNLDDWHGDVQGILQECNLPAPFCAHLSRSNYVPWERPCRASGTHVSSNSCLPPSGLGDNRGANVGANKAAIRHYLTSQRFPDTSSRICKAQSSTQEGKVFSSTHITSMRFIRKDTFYDFTVPLWHNYEHAGIWHHNSGKSFVSAAKVAKFLLNMPPPERNTPFWVLSTTMDLVTANCWGQNLSRFIPQYAIKNIVWHSATRSLPRAVVLAEHGNGNNYVIEFKSYDQGRQRLQAANIVGLWLDEQCPFDILTELWARTRKWNMPGSKIYSLTPLEPDTKLEEIYSDPPASWRFYRMNTRCAAIHGHVTEDYLKQIEENELAELIETRLTGAFARYEGAIYPTFNPRIHVIEPIPLHEDWTHFRGIDLGWDHPTACVWAATDNRGHYYVYREMLKRQTSIEELVATMQEGWDEVKHKGRTYADYAEPLVLEEFRKRGMPCVQANKEVKAGIATVQSLLRMGSDGKPKLFIFNTCPNLIRQLRTYVWDKKKQDEPKKVEDDLNDALRYLVYSYKVQCDKEKQAAPLSSVQEVEQRLMWGD